VPSAPVTPAVPVTTPVGTPAAPVAIVTTPTPSGTALTYSGSTTTSGASFGGTATTRAAFVFGPLPSAGSTVVLSLDNQKIDFSKACESFSSVGVWSFDAAGKLLAAGTYTSIRFLPDDKVDTLRVAATLGLTFAAAGADPESITATVFDSTQSPLMGPYKLSKTNVFGGGLNACVRN
jgi:hypothetical protein